MAKSDLKKTKDWYNKDYKKLGLSAQRLYPNEELLRFMGRNLFMMDSSKRKKIKVLELGSGSCANLWMISKEGFDAYGIDISRESILLGKKMLKHWGVKAKLKEGSITNLPYKDNYFDVVIDVYGTCCLNEKDFDKTLSEIARVLKKAGLFFTFTLGKLSDEFKNYKPSKLIDKSTLNKISRPGSPHFGNNYPLRYIHSKELKIDLVRKGFKVKYLERNTRSYFNSKEIIEFITAEALNNK